MSVSGQTGDRPVTSPAVTVYIPTFNYGRYLRQAIDSVLRQTMSDWELIIVDDGSTDNTSEILGEYRGHPKIRIVEQENRGLNASNNVALRLANGRFIIRLDPDDYFDENIILILSNVLESKPDVGLVYPDYYLVDEDGNVIEQVRRKNLAEEVELLDLPAHGAGTLIRRECLLELQGYDEAFRCQDGYGLWLRFIRSYKPYNVNLPLFYYRQHRESLTSQRQMILDTRGEINKQAVDRFHNGARPRVLGFIPAVRNPGFPQGRPLAPFGDAPLLWHTLEQARLARTLDRLVISTDDPDVVAYVTAFPDVTVVRRPESLTAPTTRIEETVRHALDELRATDGYEPDAVCILYINTPLRRFHHIDRAVDAMVIFGTDSVLSVEEELSFCYFHRRFGLTPVAGAARELRIERDALYRETGAVLLTTVATLRAGDLLGAKIGHVTMLPEESVRIHSDFSHWLAEKILQERPGRSQLAAPQPEDVAGA